MGVPAPATASLPRRVTSAPLSESLAGLFERLERCPGPPSIRDLERSLEGAALDLADILPHTASDRGAYVRTLIRQSEHYEALVMCWLPGQHSPVHDHNGSACAVQVIQGAATETVYQLGADGLADPVSQRIYRVGEIACSADADVHSLGNLATSGDQGPVALVTLHIYAPQLRSSRKYTARGVPRSATMSAG